MATAGGLELNEVLQSSPGKANFMRLMKLLVCGGTKVVRRLFDLFIPPNDLANKLNNPVVLTILQGLKNSRVLTNPEWNKLYPSNPTDVKSESFDLTLLVKLLRNICGLTAPVNGWDNLPSSSDNSLEAALATIKWYRNKYSHTNDGMEVSDDDFDDDWNDIKGAILRIVSHTDPSRVAKCEKDIDKSHTAPLSPIDMDRVKDNLGCSELLVLCTTRIVTTGAEWVQASAFILANYVKDIVKYFDPTRGVEVVDVNEGSIELVLWVTDLDALERFWRRYETGELRKELRRILITEELKRLADGDDVELEVCVSEEQYKKAHEQLKAKEEQELAQEVETKLRIEDKPPQFEIFDGNVIEDGENKFQAHLAVITSKDQVEQVLAELKKKDSDVAEATHNIWAYRIFDADKMRYDENCDDDGDDTSGARVLRFLQRTEAKDVMIVVSCWYETTADDLGPVRYKYIQKSVMDLLLTHRMVKIQTSKIKKYSEEIEMSLEKETSQFQFFDGDIFIDGENKFQAHLAVITSKDQVEQVLVELKKKDPDVAEATHNIWAYRIFDAEKNAYLENCDDDGDDTSGAKVLRFLQRTEATDVMVVVSCWYETTADDLGPVRFKFIQKSVLDLILACGIVELQPSKIKKYFEEIKYTPFEKVKEQETPKFEILHGETIEDRKSTFQGHLADITSREQVDQVLAELKKDRKIARAKYNMWACRIYDEKKKSYLEEDNDDGENQGGERLLHLLQRSDAKNVVVIVTRWHGGIHLGTDRFKHINKCASDILQQRSRLAAKASTTSDPKETRKKSSKKHK